MIKGGYYIKARCIQESEIAHCPPHFREIWDWLLMKANHVPRKTNGRTIERGQLFTSYKEISDGLSWKVGYRTERYKKWEIAKATKWLTKATMIATLKATRGIVITVLNYDEYQDPMNYESNKKATRKQQGGSTRNKNIKNIKKETSVGGGPKTIPKDFKVTEEMERWFNDQSFKNIKIISATDEFIDYWKSEGKKKKNWNATWRNGMRKMETWNRPKDGDSSWKTT